MWFSLDEDGQEFRLGLLVLHPDACRVTDLDLNQHTVLSLLRMDFPKPSFISFLLSKNHCLVCLIPPAERTKILNSTVWNQIQSLTFD